MGIVGGMLCGLFGVGAMLGVCVTRMTDTMTEFKGNVSMVFAVENTIRLITYAVLGLFTMSAIRTAMILIGITDTHKTPQCLCNALCILPGEIRQLSDRRIFLQDHFPFPVCKYL